MKKFSIILLLLITLNFKVEAQEVKSNPGISTNILGLWRHSNSDEGKDHDSEAPNGFHLQEAEFRFTSNIDAYFRGDVVLAVEPEHGEYHVEPEEVFIETLSIPNFTIRFGKFYALVDRHNHLHTHSFPFIDGLLTNERILGHHGLNETGASVAYLLPTPWYFEVVAQSFSAKEESELFVSDSANDLAHVIFVKNLWELGSSATVELDLAWGRGGVNKLYSTSLTYKWRPLAKSTYRSFLWTTQFLQKEHQEIEEELAGISSWVQWQFGKRWWLQGRSELLDLSKSGEEDKEDEKKHSLLLGFIPSEYSGLRLQYDRIDKTDENRISLQLNMTIGVHPAHNY